MRVTDLSKNKINMRWLVIKKFAHIMGVKPVHIILPILLSFIVAALDGISLVLLIPLVKGMENHNFAVVRNIPILRDIIRLLPEFADQVSANLSFNKSMFLFLVFFIFFVIIAKNIMSYFNTLVFSYWHARFKNNMFKFIFNRFLSFGKLFFDRTNQGYLNLVLSYTDNLLLLLRTFENSIKNFLTLMVYFITMFYIDVKLSVFTLFIFPLLYLLLRYSIKRIGKIAALKNNVQIELNRKVFNLLTCIPLVKAYSKEDECKKEYATTREELRKLDFRTDRIIGLIQPIQEVLITGVLLLMIAIVALILAREKAGDIAVFVVFFYAARRALPMFTVINDVKVAFAQAKPPMKEILNIVDDKDKFLFMEGGKEFGGLKHSIELRHLRFSYQKEIQVLKDVNLTFEKGKTTAIVGPTGSGKTTLVSLILRFYDCPPSTILVDGSDIREFKLKSLREHIAFVSQETMLFNDTLRNNLVFGLDRAITQDELIEVTKKARLYDFIMSLPKGFETETGDRGVKLSGGEKQRLAIARSLLKNADIFILDEATSSLDSKTESLIQESIQEALKGRSAIIIAHRLSTIKNADKIVVLENGRVTEEGSLNELIDKKGSFYEYWQAQKFY